MTRINVYAHDEGTRTLAGWFDSDKAELFREATEWDGQNDISANTGSQWNHQALYRTAQGRWVMHDWSQWQGTLPSYRFIGDEAARRWLLENDWDKAVEQHFGPVEEERGPGRPEVGRPVNVRLGDELLAAVDAWAAAHGVSRAEAVRTLVASAITGEFPGNSPGNSP